MRPRPLQLRGRSSPTLRLADPLVAHRSRARPRRRGARARRGDPPDPRGARRRRRRRRSACSAAPAAPTRTRSPGRSSPTRSASTYRDAQFGDGLPAEVLGLPRATIDEAANAATVDPARPRPQRGAAGPVPAAARRRRARSARKIDRVLLASTTGLTRYAWRSVRHAARHVARRDRRRRSPTPTSPSSSPRATSCRRRPRQPRRVRRRPPSPRSQALLDGIPDAKVLPGAPPRQRRRRTVSVGLAPADAEHDGLATLQAAADGKLDLLVLLGADPINDCPDADLARRALAGARRVISIDTFPSRVDPAGRRRAARPPAFGEQTGTTTNLEGRVSTRAQKVTPHGTARPDWMIAAELALLDLGHDLGFGSHVERRHAAIAATSRRIAASPPRRSTPTARRARRRSSDDCRASNRRAARNSYDYRLVVESQALRSCGRYRRCRRSLAKLAIGAGAHVHPLDLDARRRGRRRRGASSSAARRRSCCRSSPTTRCQRGVVWAPFNQPGADRRDLIDASASVTDVGSSAS